MPHSTAHFEDPAPDAGHGKVIIGGFRGLLKTGICQLAGLLLLGACSAGITVHDETRAAQLAVDFFTALKSKQGIRLAYAWTDDRYKTDVSFDEFVEIVSLIRAINKRAPIRLVGFEVFGPAEILNVYARSDSVEGRLYYRLTLAGTKTRDYYLLEFDFTDSEHEKTGIYREYRQAIQIEGV